MILILIVLVPQYTMLRILKVLFNLFLIFYHIMAYILHCSSLNTSHEPCLSNVVNSEHTVDIYINKSMNECYDQITCISLYHN